MARRWRRRSKDKENAGNDLKNKEGEDMVVGLSSRWENANMLIYINNTMNYSLHLLLGDQKNVMPKFLKMGLPRLTSPLCYLAKKIIFYTCYKYTNALANVCSFNLIAF
jgi:hypothetical protein